MNLTIYVICISFLQERWFLPFREDVIWNEILLYSPNFNKDSHWLRIVLSNVNFRQVKCVVSMCNHRSIYTLLNCRIHSVIDDIIGPTARAGHAQATAPADITPVPPRELVEWKWCNIVWLQYLRERWDENFWRNYCWNISNLSSLHCIIICNWMC